MKSLNTQEPYTPAIYQCALNLPCWLTFCWAPFLEGYEAKIPEERSQQAQQPQHKVGGDRDLLQAKLAAFSSWIPPQKGAASTGTTADKKCGNGSTQPNGKGMRGWQEPPNHRGVVLQQPTVPQEVTL